MVKVAAVGLSLVLCACGLAQGVNRIDASVPPDAADAHVDMIDAGIELIDAGNAALVDGGNETLVLALSAQGPVLVRGVPDSTRVTAHLTVNGRGVEGAAVILTSSSGSLVQSALVTDANGDAVTTLNVAVATMAVRVTARSGDATAGMTVQLVDPNRILWTSNGPRLPNELTVRGGPIDSMPLFFRVSDAFNQPIEGLLVSFEVTPGSAEAALTTTSVRTDADGFVQTTLQAGTQRGVVRVNALVAATAGANPLNAAAEITVHYGTPSDGRLELDCSAKSLGALPVPRPEQASLCTATVLDRFNDVAPYPIEVRWLAEAGTIPTVTSTNSGAGRFSVTYLTGPDLPREVAPILGEPFEGEKNPRDMFVTILAAVQGEEEFWDSASVPEDGIWQPGEWFVDLPEPYLDENDNGTWDPGEPFLDTDRLNCTTGIKVPKNNRWDGPNGCWDHDTVIWRTTRVVYTGDLDTNHFESTLPSTMMPGETVTAEFHWFDSYFNGFASDRISISTPIVSGYGCSVTAALSDLGNGLGHTAEYYVAKATEQADGSVVETGTCTALDRVMPPTAGEVCTRGFRITGWKTKPLSGTLTLSSLDAGVASQCTWNLVIANSQSRPPATHQFKMTFSP